MWLCFLFESCYSPECYLKNAVLGFKHWAMLALILGYAIIWLMILSIALKLNVFPSFCSNFLAIKCGIYQFKKNFSGLKPKMTPAL